MFSKNTYALLFSISLLLIVGYSTAQTGSASSQLPPGHPPISSSASTTEKPSDTVEPDEDEALPPGHPQVGTSPHGSKDPGGLFQPPSDTAAEDTTLTPGTISVTIRDGQDNPIPNAAVRLHIVRNTVAKGESQEQLDGVTNAEGNVLFEKMQFTAGTSYQVSTSRGPARFTSLPFILSDKSGKRVVVHAYDSITNFDEAMVVFQGIAYLQLRDDAISVEQLYNVYNFGDRAFVGNLTTQLPNGFRALNVSDSMDDVSIQKTDTGTIIAGTIGPGEHELTFRYQIPLTRDEMQSFTINLPPRVAQARVLMEASKTMDLRVSGFPNAQPTQTRDGRRLLFTEKQGDRAEGGIHTLDITLTGLPTPGPGRWIAIAFALIAVVGSVWFAFSNAKESISDDERKELLDAKQSLLDEIVLLEKAHAKGDVGDKNYDRIRNALLDALGNILEKLSPPKPSQL